jgi:hypothetical protein
VRPGSVVGEDVADLEPFLDSGGASSYASDIWTGSSLVSGDSTGKSVMTENHSFPSLNYRQML